MTLTGYFAQNILAMGIFAGWGLGLWNTMDQSQVLIVVLAIWSAQLALCPIWIARFQHGPLEWAWRSLYYSRFQPLVRREPALETVSPRPMIDRGDPHS